MAFKVKQKKKRDRGAMDIVDDVYDMGEDIVQRANPFTMAGRSLGYSEKTQEDIRKGKHKVSSPHLKMLGQGDIKQNGIQNKRKKKKKHT